MVNPREFKIKFRGVRGSYPATKKDFFEFGGDTSCVEVNANGHLILLDAGTGIIDVGTELANKNIKATILLSHIHNDHIQGLTFFSPLHKPDSKIDIFCGVQYEQPLEKELADLLFGKSFPLNINDIKSDLNIKTIKPDEKIIPGDVVISSFHSDKHPKKGVTIYKIECNGKSLVYATDIECCDEKDDDFCEFIKGCDLLIHDAQYTEEDYNNPNNSKKGFGHSTFEMALDSQKHCSAKQMVFYHLDPLYTDEKLKQLKKRYENPTATIAYKGLEIDL